MGMVTLRVSDQTKRKMSRFSRVNWSDVLREAIEDRLKLEESKNMAQAVATSVRLTRDAPPAWNSVEVIRHWRERRAR